MTPNSARTAAVTAAPLGIREQRKRNTREVLIVSAKELFAARGYDHVTVAEIAAGAGVTAKTAFQHFRSKDELLLAVLEGHHDRLLRALRERDRGQAPLEALTQWLLKSNAEGPPDGLERFQRTVGASQAVAALRRRLYEEWENAVVGILAEEADEGHPSPRTRLIAAQLISMVRIMSSQEVRDLVGREPLHRRAGARAQYVREASALLAAGLATPDSLSAPPAARRG